MCNLALHSPSPRGSIKPRAHTGHLGETTVHEAVSPVLGRATGATKLSILLIDDDPGLRWLHNKALTAHGHHCSEAPDGRAGLLACQQLQPDLILLDLMMPGLDGLSVLKLIRQQNTAVGVIIVSALPAQQRAQRVIHEGADGYLPKPATLQTLLHEIDRVGSLVRLRHYHTVC